MAKNPISTKNPYKDMFRGNRAKVLKGMHRPEGAGNFDNADDHALMAHIDLKEGTVQHTPAVDKDLANKKYVDDNFAAILHASTHEVGGSDLVDHDLLTNFLSNEHIDWTGASVSFNTSAIDNVMGSSDAAFGNPVLELKRNGADVELLIHEDAGTNEARIHLRRGTTDWEIINNENLIFKVEGSEVFKLFSSGNVQFIGEIRVNDNKPLALGNGQDADIFYNGTDLIIDSSIVGTGLTKIVKGLSLNLVSKTGTYIATKADNTILCGSGNETFTVTLPAASGVSGIIYNIKNIGTGTITVDGASAETIDGGLTAVLNNQFESITIQCDGSNWHII